MVSSRSSAGLTRLIGNNDSGENGERSTDDTGRSLEIIAVEDRGSDEEIALPDPTRAGIKLRINDKDALSIEGETEARGTEKSDPEENQKQKHKRKDKYREKQIQRRQDSHDNSTGQSNVTSLPPPPSSSDDCLVSLVSVSSSGHDQLSSALVTPGDSGNNPSTVNVVGSQGGHSDDLLQDEESYEGFGFARALGDGDGDVDLVENDGDGEDDADGSSSTSAPSPTGPNSLSLKSMSPSSTIGRHSWLRTSLRRTPPSCNSARQRQLGSNALASQLYRSGSFNSSGRGSTCDAADDMYSDVSLEDDVLDLNHRVRMIQEQMHVLTDTHSAGEERYARAKQENATLQARILMLEEAAKDAEARAQEKLEAEQRRHREWANRLEREKQLQLENYAIKMQTIEHESSSLREQIARLREQLDSAREDRTRFESVVQDLGRQLGEARENERQALVRSNEARIVLDAAKQELLVRTEDRHRIDELALEIAHLRARNKSLEESRDELQAAAALDAGRQLLLMNLPRSTTGTTGYDALDDVSCQPGGGCSLAAELSADACRLPSQSPQTPLTIPELKQALKEQQEVNAQLRSYIDGILLNIVENYPQLLEVKQASG